MTDRVNLAEKLALFGDHWKPRTVAQLNKFDIMVVKVQGEFVWHKHDETDDFFLVLPAMSNGGAATSLVRAVTTEAMKSMEFVDGVVHNGYAVPARRCRAAHPSIYCGIAPLCNQARLHLPDLVVSIRRSSGRSRASQSLRHSQLPCESRHRGSHMPSQSRWSASR